MYQTQQFNIMKTRYWKDKKFIDEWEHIYLKYDEPYMFANEEVVDLYMYGEHIAFNLKLTIAKQLVELKGKEHENDLVDFILLNASNKKDCTLFIGGLLNRILS